VTTNGGRQVSLLVDMTITALGRGESRMAWGPWDGCGLSPIQNDVGNRVLWPAIAVKGANRPAAASGAADTSAGGILI